MNKIPLILLLAAATGCVAKKDFVRVQSELDVTKTELDKARTALSELEALRPELESRNEALAQAARDLEDAKTRLSELDQARKKMEESLQSELAEKSIRLETLNDRLTVTFVDKILFDSGSARVKEAGRQALKKVAASLTTLANHRIHVEGHTDDQKIGPVVAKQFPTNWELSTARAAAVVRVLQDAGLPPAHLYAVGAGPFHPVAPNDTTQGRAQNRRVEIILSPLLDKK